MKKLFMIMAAVLLVCAPVLSAQTKGETSLYTKTLKKPSVKAYNKFLSKYPTSVYAEEILTLRDSTIFSAIDTEDAEAVKAFAENYPDSPLSEKVAAIIERHNTSPLSREEAVAAARAAVPAVQDAAGWRRDNHDQILGLNISEGKIHLSILSSDGSNWTLKEERTIVPYTLDSEMSPSRLVGETAITTVGANKYLSFSYLNEASGSIDQEYVAVLYDPVNDNATNAMFYGRSLLTKPSDTEYRIEGRTPETLSAGGMTAEQVTLLSSFSANPCLVQIAHEDELTDESIKWWLEKNPTAQSSATRISFGSLDEESSLVAAYKKAKKENGTNFNAALFDIRGYTVVCAYSKPTKSYLLVWCEPVCKNKNRDQLLNTIYFENDNTLALYYYKGKTTYKWHLNLATKSLRK